MTSCSPGSRSSIVTGDGPLSLRSMWTWASSGSVMTVRLAFGSSSSTSSLATLPASTVTVLVTVGAPG